MLQIALAVIGLLRQNFSVFSAVVSQYHPFSLDSFCPDDRKSILTGFARHRMRATPAKKTYPKNKTALIVTSLILLNLML